MLLFSSFLPFLDHELDVIVSCLAKDPILRPPRALRPATVVDLGRRGPPNNSARVRNQNRLSSYLQVSDMRGSDLNLFPRRWETIQGLAVGRHGDELCA